MSAETLRGLKHSYIWGAVAFGVLIFAGGVTPWDALLTLIEEQGVGDEQAQLIGFVVGYTLPLTAGFTIIGLAWAFGAFENVSGPVVLIAMAVVLLVTGYLAAALGLGQLPLPDTRAATSGPWYARPLAAVLQGYINRYGIGFSLSALVISVGLTLSAVKMVAESNDPQAAPPA